VITREMLITVSPTPREIECEIWNMDSTEQVDLILAMCQRYEIECGNVCMQSQAISDDLKKLLNREERIKRVLMSADITKPVRIRLYHLTRQREVSK